MKNLSIANAIQFIVLFSIFSSILYDLSYYMTLSIDVKTLPLNLTELLYSSINWLPYSLIFFVIGMILGNGITKVIPEATSKLDAKIMRYFIMSGGIVLMFTYLYYGFEKIGAFWMALTIFSISTYHYVETRIINKYLTSLASEYKKLFGYIPIYIPFVLLFASLNAQLSINNTHDQSIISFNGKEKDLNVTILRSLNMGYLVKEDNKIKIIYSSQIREISLMTIAPHFKGFNNNQDLNITKEIK